MSVRTDRKEAPQINMNIPVGSSTSGIPAAPGEVAATIDAAQQADHQLGSENEFNCNNPEHPLSRTVCVTIRASLNDLCLKKEKSQWKPSTEAMKNILQQRKFLDLTGASEMQGDLKSVVLHDLTMASQSSSFPIGNTCLAILTFHKLIFNITAF